MALVALVCGCLKTKLVNILSNHPSRSPQRFCSSCQWQSSMQLASRGSGPNLEQGWGRTWWAGRPRGLEVTATVPSPWPAPTESGTDWRHIVWDQSSPLPFCGPKHSLLVALTIPTISGACSPPRPGKFLFLLPS